MKTVIVLGNARSGTSMIGGIVHHLGFNMHPQNNPSSQNPKGSYEDVNFIHWTSQLHRSMHGNNKENIQECSNKIKELIIKRNAQGEDWGFKSALTHEVLRHIDLSLFVNPYFILNYRNPLNNAKSWQVHMKDNYGEHVSLEEALLNVTKGQQSLSNVAKTQLKDYKKLYTNYEDVKKNTAVAAESIMRFLDIEPTPELLGKIKDFILPQYTTLR